MIYRTVLAFDRVRQQIEITSVVYTDEAGNDRARLKYLYDRAVVDTERIEKLLLGGLQPKTPAQRPPGAPSIEFTSNRTREDFEEAVRKIKEHIAAGDCYQAVLSQRFTTRITAPPIEIYRALRAINPSPYMYILRGFGVDIIGASPEMLLRVEDGVIETHPIAGTRRRGHNAADDQRLADELLADPKERAEHLMLVDLGRNDIGRVAEAGTVEVPQFMEIERYSHVMHLVSRVTGKLRSGITPLDALRACFPAGTVSGAPKIRAIEIIAELEPDQRGPYAGCVGFLGFDGTLETAITIRTIYLQNGVAHVQAGAGVVADSVPALEWQETQNKARALLRAIELAEAMKD
jgi:anthranilate synthase component 1